MTKYYSFTLLLIVLFGLFSCGKSSTSPSDETIGMLEISPPGGSYDTAISVHISCTTYGVDIHYTTDGSTPTRDSDLYQNILQINSDTTLKARAFKTGFIPSKVAYANYEFSSAAVQAVVITPPGGTYQSPNKITRACPTPDATIHYTLDGSDPTEESSIYGEPIMVCGSITIRARAYAPDMIPSIISEARFIMQLVDPVFSLEGGLYSTAQTVSISHPQANAEIRYTTNGSEPTPSSALYSSPLNIPVNTVLKARAYLEDWEPSNVQTAFYIINLANQMQLVPGGTFHNGTANVTLSPFYIGRREVTELEWVYIMLDMDIITPDSPKAEINWVSAIEYCNYRSIAEGFDPCYSYGNSGTIPALWPENWQSDHTQISCDWNATGYRLPTEMEWMYAARGANISQDYIYSGSDDIDAVAWYSSNSSGTAAVGTKQPNELGLYDMSGNVWEFCWDLYHNQYPTMDTQDPTGPAAGYLRVMRGGSFSTDASNCTVSRRFYTPANLSADSHGFRVVRRY